MKQKILLLLFLSLCVCRMLANSSSSADRNDSTLPDECSFPVERVGGHYVFTTTVNHKDSVCFLLESGIHVMLIDSAFVVEHSGLLDVELIPIKQKQKMNLGGKVYHITHKTKGTIDIGNGAVYHGEIFVLSNYDCPWKAAIPVQNLRHKKDNSRTFELDLANNMIYVLTKTLADQRKEGCLKYEINTDTYMEMPAVRTSLKLADGKELQGNFNIDLGNPMLLFLRQQDEKVQTFLNENSALEILQARDANGKVVAEAFVAEQCSLCGIPFMNATIAITKSLPRFTTQGNIGLRFFASTLSIFDFDKLELWVKQPLPSQQNFQPNKMKSNRQRHL